MRDHVFFRENGGGGGDLEYHEPLREDQTNFIMT